MAENPPQGGAEVAQPAPPQEPTESSTELSTATGHMSGPWINAWYDPVAGFSAHSSCIRVADITGDGEGRLLVADTERKRLRVYKGTTVVSDSSLLEKPAAIAVFYPEDKAPRIPSVAVAAGPFIFIYRNLRPYFKFTLPSLDVEPKEVEVWNELAEGKIDANDLAEVLSTLRDNGAQITSKSADLLTLENPEERQAFAKSNIGGELSQHTSIVCMETIQKNSDEATGVSQLIVGTESKHVMILNAPGSSILTKVKLKGIPVQMSVYGKFDVEYRIVVACRDGNVYSIKNGEVMGSVVELEALPVGVQLVEKSFYVACMGNVVHNFHVRGKKNFTIYFPSPVTNIELMTVPELRNLKLLLVCLRNGEVRLYNEKHLVHTLKMGDIITGCRFGSFAREANTLVLTFRSGAIAIKILGRTSNLESSTITPGPPPEQDIPLNVPKKTRLYVEQTEREREQAVEMHTMFQRDLCKLRLTTARAYVRVIQDGQGPISYTSRSSIRVTANIRGLGPVFKLDVTLRNMGHKQQTNINLALRYNQALYRIPHPVTTIPLLVPGLDYEYEIDVQCIDENGGSDIIIVYVSEANSVVPVVSLSFNPPVSETLEF